jgi:hypothetical protein
VWPNAPVAVVRPSSDPRPGAPPRGGSPFCSLANLSVALQILPTPTRNLKATLTLPASKTQEQTTAEPSRRTFSVTSRNGDAMT